MNNAVQNNTNSALLDVLITKNDRAISVELLDKISQASYLSNTKKAYAAIFSEVPEYLSHAFSQLLQNSNTTELLNQLQELKAVLTTLPVASLQLPYTPSRKQLLELHEKLKKKFKADLLIEYEQAESNELTVQIDFNGKRYTQSAHIE